MIPLTATLLESQTVNLFDLYSHLPSDGGSDPRRGVPAYAASCLGSYWTEEAAVPLEHLADVDAAAISDTRWASVAQARRDGKALPPIEISVWRNGETYLVDGNHRLEDARESGQPNIRVKFTFPDL